MQDQIKYEDLKKLIDPQYVLFGKSMNPDIKLQHRIQVIGKEIVVHQDQFSTKRFNEIMALAKQQKSQEDQQQAMRDRLWQHDEDEQENEDNDWETEEEEQKYLQWAASPAKDVGVLNFQSQNQPHFHE